jgi:hypothetical protein
MGLIMVSTGTALFLFVAGIVHAEEKVTIGLVEDVILLPWGLKIPARIDTGAATSSLDARELIVHDGVAEFKLPEQFGSLQLRLPVVEWKHVRSAEAQEKRPVVEIDLCMGSKRIRVRANLNDRSQVKYPLILGRSALRKNFVVDCMQERCLPPPDCPEVRSQ